MELDLQRDFTEIHAYLAERVRRFDPKTHDGLGGPGPVKIIEVGYEYLQSGWVIAVLDTRPDAEPDGEWTQELDVEANMLLRPHWVESQHDASWNVSIIGYDVQKSVLPNGRLVLAVLLGELVKAVVIKARADGMFAGLAKAAGCELGVEHFDGEYGWPQY